MKSLRLTSRAMWLVQMLAMALVATTITTPTLAKMEMCNGQDDDGDGLIDEDFPMIGQPCWAYLGPCRAQGKWMCGFNLALCDAKQTVLPKIEECNNEDDDCDGVIDNFNMSGVTSCYVDASENPCHEGHIVCDHGPDALRSCHPNPPMPEVCGNDIDENCDGVAEICIPGGSGSGGEGNTSGGEGGSGGLGVPCRPTMLKEFGCSTSSTPNQTPLLPLSAGVLVVGALALSARRRRRQH